MLTIKTNNVPRPVIDAYELTDKERQEFDYLDWEAIDNGEDNTQFVRYKGELYDLSQFTFCRDLSAPMNKWDGYFSDSAFSGILIRHNSNELDYVVVATYYS